MACLKTSTHLIFYLILHADEVAEVRGCIEEAICTTATNGLKSGTFGESLRQFLNRQDDVTITINAAAEIGVWVFIADAFYFKEMKLAY